MLEETRTESNTSFRNLPLLVSGVDCEKTGNMAQKKKNERKTYFIRSQKELGKGSSPKRINHPECRQRTEKGWNAGSGKIGNERGNLTDGATNGEALEIRDFGYKYPTCFLEITRN